MLRKEDARHLHGRGQFVSDMILPRQLEVAFLRSPVAHARILEIRKPAAAADRVFVRSDMPQLQAIVAPSTVPGFKLAKQHPLAQDKLRFVGEPVAMCVGGSRAEAEDLAEQIQLEIEELPALVDAYHAKSDPTVRVHEEWDDNLFLTLNVDNRFAEHSKDADVVVKRRIDLSRQCLVPLEGKAALAYWDDRANQLVLYASSQTPHVVRVGVARFLGLPQEQVRVIAPDVGGGFGYKSVLQPEDLCVAWLALNFRRPFRYVEDRREHLVAGASARQHHYEITAYANRQGRLLALDAAITIDGGAYSNFPYTIGIEPGLATGNLPGPYDWLGYRCTTHCVATNKPGFLPYRSVGRAGACFAMEQMIDAVARAVGRDPAEVRLDNLVRPDQMPYDNISRRHYDSGDYPRALRSAMDTLDVPAWRARQQRDEPDGRRVGLGFACYCEQGAVGQAAFARLGPSMTPGYDQAAVRITAGGGLEVRVGVQSHGQGLETTLAQLAHEVLGIDVARIRVIHGDTGTTPFSTGTFGSRSMVMAGGATLNACRMLIPRIVKIGAHLLQCQESEARFEAGRVHGPSASVGLDEITAAWYLQPERLPQDVDRAGLEASVAYKPKVETGVFSYASHAVAVAVDPRTGKVEILDYVVVEDCGTVVNPMIVEGQTLGGVAQGIGTAMYEQMQYDANGQPAASTFADYLVPGPTEIPAVRVSHFETASPYTELGMKGMGEGGAIAPPAAVIGAINDALGPLGVDFAETPVTPEKVLEAIARASSMSKARA